MENRKALSPTLLRSLLGVLIVAASLRLLRAAWLDSMDFHVYWKAAQSWVGQGNSPYLYDGSERGFVFKYPPWILPFFAPFGLLPEKASQMIWAVVCLFCVFYSANRLIRYGLSQMAVIVTTALFWWIWLGHFYSGQFTLILLAAALWAMPDESSSGKLAFLGIVFSAKVYSLVSLLGRARECLRWKTIAAGVGMLAALHLIVMAVFWAHGHSVSLVELYRQWIQAGTSGGQELGASIVRGQMNHSFTAGILRAFHVDPTHTAIDQKVALILVILFSSLWYWISRSLSALEKWAGWLGVGLIVHPLVWHHSFVLAYPICALALDRAVKVKSPKLIACALFGISCIGILIPNIFGLTLITPLEWVSVKSWGVCFAAAALVASKKYVKLSI